MTLKEIINGLKFTIIMFMQDPVTGEVYTKPKNELDKITVDACKGAIELFEQTRWIPVSERLPEAGEYDGDVAKYYLVQNEYGDMLVARYTHSGYWEYIYHYTPCDDEIVAWMPLPQKYQPEIPTVAEGSEE